MKKVKFRNEFILPKNYKLNWYPGHMAKTYRILPEEIKKANIFLEIRDSRIPISSGNPELNNIITPNIKRIILYNKFDLCDQNKTKKIVEKFVKDNPNKNIKYMFMSAKAQINVQKVLDMITRENNPSFRTVGTWCMVGGIPNVGKSTIINVFRGMSRDIKELSEKTVKSAKTGAIATTTRNVDSFKVNLEPLIFIIDTPGIMPPKIYNNETGLKLSVCGNIKDKIAGKDTICDYLLYSLNKLNLHSYVKAFRMKEPTDNIEELVSHIFKEFQIQNKNNAFDFIMKYFQQGKLGKITFDEKIEDELSHFTNSKESHLP
jgi:ribosome biogenesis GTPase A